MSTATFDPKSLLPADIFLHRGSNGLDIIERNGCIRARHSGGAPSLVAIIADLDNHILALRKFCPIRQITTLELPRVCGSPHQHGANIISSHISLLTGTVPHSDDIVSLDLFHADPDHLANATNLFFLSNSTSYSASEDCT